MLDWQPISKRPPVASARAVAPNLHDSARKAFPWDVAATELDGLPGGPGLNVAHAAVDRRVPSGPGQRTALRGLGRRWEIRDACVALTILSLIAGSHTVAIRMSYRDWTSLVNPRVAYICFIASDGDTSSPPKAQLRRDEEAA